MLSLTSSLGGRPTVWASALLPAAASEIAVGLLGEPDAPLQTRQMLTGGGIELDVPFEAAGSVEASGADL